ncbi:hypothetical protein JQX09_08040 [Sulfitobacter pseudonitzschiae]|uniref:hypothetical protein n=1 Tax=Pseudosulfitobacter pseudonitzschiae TaxID=1402135 RepID=UPI001DEB2AC5|nr:hypothetical protein [Pseudosulfitobacter pseudonitzschiae]MBM2291858.1 hypothetical protein [Pseudosulfitobacter pseudonitzschiae]MBM2296776.1 hypothetical protein [Pseudosulfitobacter pseudonitzschiae]MBM2301689.1 hypothetical protein [Pseudosulfitobacter pseudonitzschiae]MBM2316386.1 hypothetical protein [Pseudosulfitobacter pseudonitzschiae]MBM2359410.1 hypothetical protein [Pseudosulfitobacter pseudonitzschiae]
MTRIGTETRGIPARSARETGRVLHCVNLRYKTVTKRPLFSGVCYVEKKIPFEFNGLPDCLKNGQFNETCQIQRKIPNPVKLSKDLSTGMVDIKSLEPSSIYVAAHPVGDSV